MTYDVIIAGAGPTGLMLAGELAIAGVEALIVERRPSQELAGSRAGGLHARTIEVLDQRGIAERFLDAGQAGRSAFFAQTPLDLGDQPTRHPVMLALWQNRIERLLADWVAELGVAVQYGTEIEDLAHDDHGVDVRLSGGRTVRATYVVGCDGGRSLVRRLAGIDFAGWDASTSYVIAEVATRDEPAWGFRKDARGTHGIGKLDDGRARIVLEEPPTARGEPTLDELRAMLVERYGTDFGAHTATWLSRFTDAARQATAYRERRILLAGDAAHVHSPVGGQGLNLGVQDAVNLGWKLARVVRGTSPDALLDTYHAERHPVGARVLRTTMAQTALRRTDSRTEALQGLTADLLTLDEPRRRYAAMMSGLDIHYDLGAGHPLLGRRMPDLDLEIDGAPTRVFALLRDARPLLLRFDGTASGATAPGLREVIARTSGPWALPVIGAVPAPAAVLVRPDGHVAWVGDGTDTGLREAIARWFGAE